MVNNYILINVNLILNYISFLFFLYSYPIPGLFFDLGPSLLLVLLFFFLPFLLLSLESPSDLILPLIGPFYIELLEFI